MNSNLIIQGSLLVLGLVYLQIGNSFFNRINEHFVKTGDAHLASDNLFWWGLFVALWPIFFGVGLVIGIRARSKKERK